MSLSFFMLFLLLLAQWFQTNEKILCRIFNKKIVIDNHVESIEPKLIQNLSLYMNICKEEAKQKVNEEMEKGNLREEQTNESNATENAKQEEINQGEERTPWGDAMRRSRKF